MLNKYNFLVNKFVSKSGVKPEISGVLVTKTGTAATDRFTLLEVSAPDMELSDYPIIPGQETAETEAHIMPIDAANQIQADLKKIKGNLPILQNTASLKLTEPDQAGFITTNLEMAKPVIYRKIDGEYPNYKQIIPTGDPVYTFNVSPEFLKRIAEVYCAIGNTSVEVKLYPDKDGLFNQPITFEAKTPQGQTVKALIMPIKS
jgi:DNA polymerase III sliding clamp (beta) subunit (PCNA family)